MSYLASNKIQVFPSTKRGSYQPSARLMSEASLVNIVNKLIDTDGFVVTPDEDVVTTNSSGTITGQVTNKPFEFNIKGYYFIVSSLSDLISGFGSYTNIYAKIHLNTTDNYVELAEQDDDNQYKGINFVTSVPSSPSAGDYYLWLLAKPGSYWVVPIDSRVKFVYDFAIGVDGGDLDI